MWAGPTEPDSDGADCGQDLLNPTVTVPIVVRTYCQCSAVSSSGGPSAFQKIRGIKKPPPQLSSSGSRLSKNILSTAEKVM